MLVVVSNCDIMDIIDNAKNIRCIRRMNEVNSSFEAQHHKKSLQTTRNVFSCCLTNEIKFIPNSVFNNT